MTAADQHYVNVAVEHGCRRALAEIIVEQARRWKLPISVGFALCEKESGFRNVFGHDRTIFSGAGEVTHVKYVLYRTRRRLSGNRLMQGVGVCQLTWWQTQDLADQRGGCWKSEHNISVGFQTLAANIREYGYAKGCERYNGTGPAAVAYSRDLRERADTWHRRLAS
jgi:hypothetical protein